MLLGKLIVGLTGVFLLLSLTARALGNTQPPNPALRGFVEGCEGKPQPCWYSIVPGVTTIQEARKILKKLSGIHLAGEETGSWANLSYELYLMTNISPQCKVQVAYSTESFAPSVTEIVLYSCALYLANVIELFGDMDGLELDKTGNAFIIFHDCSALTWVRNGLRPYRPTTPLYISPDLSNSAGGPLFKWHGYLPYWKYCQLEPDPAFVYKKRRTRHRHALCFAEYCAKPPKVWLTADN